MYLTSFETASIEQASEALGTSIFDHDPGSLVQRYNSTLEIHLASMIKLLQVKESTPSDVIVGKFAELLDTRYRISSRKDGDRVHVTLLGPLGTETSAMGDSFSEAFTIAADQAWA